MDATPLSIPAYGLKLNALERNPQGSPVVLLLHGWLDHAHGFDWLCDALPGSMRVVALDFRGHGRSEHHSPGSSYALADYVADVNAAHEALREPRLHLVGHSLGGTVALMFAAARPDAVASLTSVESLGPTGGAPEQSVERLRAFVSELGKAPRKRAYSNVEDAALKLRENNPGLSSESAQHMARFGTQKTDAGHLFTFDPALRRRSGMIHDEAQWMAVLRAVTAPVQVIRGSRGAPFDQGAIQARLDALRNPKVVALDGGHHVHMDRPAETARAIQDFIDANR
ncbi:MAG TPA: alpha/beta hydrolase [Myxococcaceae bacterium]